MKSPTLQLDGLSVLTDETGMFQHTKFSTIVRKEGYTTDDNARALIAALKYHLVFGGSAALQLANIYLTFLLYMQREDGRFHNLLGFDRRFRDDMGSEDCIGRALWASGFTTHAPAPEDIRIVAKEIFDRGLPTAYGFTSPRAKAFTILGLHNYQKAFPEDHNVENNIRSFARGLVDQYTEVADDEWRWFEPYLTYANPRLPQALFAAYESTKELSYLKLAKRSLDFLIEIQVLEDMFVPIGSEGWFKRNDKRAVYDQQPIEASCMVEASLLAFRLTGDEKYRKTARTAFEWYHGRNTQDILVFNPETGTCHDGITPKGLNQNQGAEATVSYYIAYLKLRENDLT